MRRLARGAELLGILPPLTAGEMRLTAARLVGLNALPDSILRITLTRGSGTRGYSPKGADSPTLVMTLHPAPRLDARKLPRIRLITSSFHVAADDPLANVKTCNKLPHILARAEADAAGADDALLLNARGELAEATSSNVFWIERETLCTPPLSAGALDGITSATVLVLAQRMGLKVRERSGHKNRLLTACGVFLTNSVRGIVEASALDRKPLKSSPLVARLHHAYAKLAES
jgi:branched-subunit amino acid aminotransferase/4-amino-4-deoxychorismate lyase